MRVYPKFNRQRFLLDFIVASGPVIGMVDLQKMLFLYSQDQENFFYDFVPYLYGCYSLQANDDMDKLAKLGWVEINANSVCLKATPSVRTQQKDLIQKFLDKLGNTRGDELIRKVYTEYPYYAINSKIAKTILGKAEYQEIIKRKSDLQRDDQVLFTIGYEGKSLERYLNQIILNDIKLVCDVRKNPISRRFGFSKSILSKSLSKIGVEYQHIAALGISSAARKIAKDNNDYRSLFKDYRDSLESFDETIGTVEHQLRTKKRVALTCFESAAKDCHRHVLSDYLKIKKKYEVIDL